MDFTFFAELKSQLVIIGDRWILCMEEVKNTDQDISIAVSKNFCTLNSVIISI